MGHYLGLHEDALFSFDEDVHSDDYETTDDESVRSYKRLCE